MKILVLTNYYPPYYLGGYELRCQTVVDEWKKKGHEVKILTTRFGLRDDVDIDSSDILRWLPTEPRPYRRYGVEGLWTAYKLKQKISRLLQKFRPNIVSVWNMGDFPKFVLCLIETLGFPLAYHIEDASWLYRDFIYMPDVQGWEYKNLESDPILRLWKENSHHSIHFLIKKILKSFFCMNIKKRPLIKVCHATFVSQYRMQEYFRLGDKNIHAEVVHGGIDVEEFAGLARENLKPPIKLLYVGQIYRQKGLHTILESLLLLEKSQQKAFKLSIAGEAHAEEKVYFEELRNVAFENKSNIDIQFLGKIKHEDLPSVYTQHDVLIFPSIIPEGFALTPVEAMANGMVVLSTATGGNAELVKDAVNAGIFKEDDPRDLMRLLTDLVSNPKKYEKLAIRARNDAVQNFSVNVMAEKIIIFLTRVVAA